MKKIFILISFIISSLFLSISFFSYNNINALNEIDPTTDKNFSQYINVIKNGIYDEPVDLQPLYINQKYTIPSNFKLVYQTDVYAPNSMNSVSLFHNYGFKVNNVFYKDLVSLDQSGTYKIEIFEFTVENGIYKTYKSLNEKFTIYLKLENYGLENYKTDFYFEHYQEVNQMIDDIENSFSNPITLLNSSIDAIKKAFDHYISLYLDNNLNYFEEDMEKNNLEILYQYNNVVYKKNINILSTKNPNIQPITDYQTLFKNVENLAFNIKNIDAQYYGKPIAEILLPYLGLNINAHTSQMFDIIVSNTSIIPTFIGNTKEKIITLQYTVTDMTNDKEYNFVRSICFYNYDYKKTDIKTIVETKTDYVEVYSDVTVDDIVKTAYLEVSVNNMIYKDYMAINSISFHTKIDTSKITGTFENDQNNAYQTYSFKVYKQISLNNMDSEILKEQKIEVYDTKAPLILIKYNKYFIDRKNNTDYMKDIRVIDNYSLVTNMIINYSLEETNENGGIIKVEATDESGIKTTLEIPFLYTSNSFTKKINQWLYNYGEFLRQIF